MPRFTIKTIAGLLFAASFCALEAQEVPLSVIQQLSTRAGEMAYHRKDWLAAQELLGNAILLNPNDGRVAYYLGTALIIDKDHDPQKLRAGSFYYARAAVLMREPSLVNWVKRQYVSMFRTPLGLNTYWEFVRNTPVAPEKAEDYPTAPPEPFDALMAFQMIRDELLSPGGQAFFEDGLSINQTPRFKGKIVSLLPQQNPIEVVLNVDDPKGDLKIQLTKPLPGTAPIGTVIEVEGLARNYRPAPAFQLMIQAEPKEVRGWPVPIPVEASVVGGPRQQGQ